MEKKKGDIKMEIAIYFIMFVYALIGGFSTLAMVIGIPAVIIWKIKRKITLHLSLTD